MNATFTRHPLTPVQLAEIGDAELDFNALAARNLMTLDEARAVVLEMAGHFTAACRVQGLDPARTSLHLYGVFPTPIRYHLLLGIWPHGGLFLHESFNVNRAPEGAKPQFAHAGWLPTARYCGEE